MFRQREELARSDCNEHEYDESVHQEVDLMDDIKQPGVEELPNQQPLLTVVPPPHVRMEFPTSEAGHMYYLRYGFDRGFGVQKNGGSTKEGRQRVILICTKGGRPKIKSKKAIPDKNKKVEKELCNARMYLKLDQSRNVWVVTGFSDVHNHPLCPDHSHRIKCFRTIKDWAIKQLELNDRAGVSIAANINAVTEMCGGPLHCGFSELDARNVIAKMRRGKFLKGDAEALMQFFREPKQRDPRFYYSYRFDDDNRLDVVFWADSTSQSWYDFFGDVVTFDATYIVNQYVFKHYI